MAEIVIDGEREIGRVNSFLFGNNLEHLNNIIYGGIFDEGSNLSDVNGFRKDVTEAAKKIKTSILRWPGGNFASGYHWQNGVGPKDERPVTHDLAWGAEESNRFGTDEFIEYCRAFGAEPYITVNVGSGTPEEAAHWVEYCNRKGNSYYAKLREKNGHPEPYNVKYWSIGNEMWTDLQVGGLPAEEYAKKYKETAKLMKRVDPNVKLTAVGAYLSGEEWFGVASEVPWNLETLKAAGEFIDYLSIHRYYFPYAIELNEENYYTILAFPTYMERKLSTVIKLIDVTKNFLVKDKDIKISMDEWNFGTHPLCGALATARFFNVLQRLSSWVEMGCFFPIANRGRRWGLISVEKEGILLESSYHAFDLYANHTGERVLDTRVQSETYDVELTPRKPQVSRSEKLRGIPYLDSSATLSNDGKSLFIATVNSHKGNRIEATVRLRDLSVKRRGRVFELNGPDVMAQNDLENPNRVRINLKTVDNAGGMFSYEFPPHSATVIELQVK